VKQTLAIAKDHPAYEGHFPDHPVLPGVVLLAQAMAALAKEGWNVETAKFLVPVEPGTPLTIEHETLASGAVRFEIASPDGVVATGSLAPA
jgi:3-hydroxymyristoyl/3-hydroxydecanoyl-(acyl carrier protein) dehydratase